MSNTSVLRCFLCALLLVALSQAIIGVAPLVLKGGKPINLDFGGEKVVTQPFKGGTRNQKRRQEHVINMHHPDLVKSQICDSNRCAECQDKSGCWHGKTFKRAKKAVMEINMAPGAATASTNYVAEVWARCSSDGGEWLIEIGEMFENGVFSVYVDNKLEREITPAQDTSEPILFHIEGDHKARIKLVFRVEDRSKAAHVSVRLRALQVDAMVEHCMSVKNGLEILGDGSDAGFLLRNNNKYQLVCLQGRMHRLPFEVQAKCVAWTSRMTDERKSMLRAFLEAAQGKGKEGKGGKGTSGKSLGGDGILVNAIDKTRAGSSEDPLQCVDPESDDPESWECECLHQMIERCDNDVNDVSCFRELMCKEAGICGRWKEKHCPQYSTSDEQSILQNRNHSIESAMMSQRGTVSSIGSMEMDSSLYGKCAG